MEDGARCSAAESLALELELQLDVLASDDFAEGTAAFLEKRTPSYGGGR